MTLLSSLVRDRVFLALALLSIATSILLVVADASGRTIDTVSYLVPAVLDLAVAVLAAMIALESREPAVSRLWRWMAASGLIYLLGDLTPAVVGQLPHHRSAPLDGHLSEPFFLLAGVLVLIAMMSYPIGFGDRQLRIRFWLDAGTVFLCAGFTSWSLTVGSPGTRSPLSLLGSLAISALVATECFAAVKLTVAQRPPFTTATLTWALLAGVLFAIGNGLSAESAASVGDRFAQIAGVWATFCLVLAFRIQLLEHRHNPELYAQRPPRPYTVLPYVAVAGMFALLVTLLPHEGLDVRAVGALILQPGIVM